MLFDVYMLTGLRMRTASSPVISKVQSKHRLHQGKTTHRKNTGVFWEDFFGPSYYMLHTMWQSKKIMGWKLLKNSKMIKLIINLHQWNEENTDPEWCDLKWHLQYNYQIQYLYSVNKMYCIYAWVCTLCFIRGIKIFPPSCVTPFSNPL